MVHQMNLNYQLIAIKIYKEKLETWYDKIIDLYQINS